MAFKPNVNFGASNVIDPTAGARQALQSVGGLLDAYGKRQQSTQEMLLREQGRQDALVQQDIANKRADAQLQLAKNQDTRAAEKSAQDTEEFGIKKNTQKQVADYTQQAQGAQVGGLTTTQGLDLSNKFDAMLASGMSGEQAAAATQSATEAVMASNLKDPKMGAQFLAEIRQQSFGDVDSAKLSDLQRLTAQPFEKKIETADQQAFEAEQKRLDREQSASKEPTGSISMRHPETGANMPRVPLSQREYYLNRGWQEGTLPTDGDGSSSSSTKKASKDSVIDFINTNFNDTAKRGEVYNKIKLAAPGDYKTQMQFLKIATDPAVADKWLGFIDKSGSFDIDAIKTGFGSQVMMQGGKAVNMGDAYANVLSNPDRYRVLTAADGKKELIDVTIKEQKKKFDAAEVQNDLAKDTTTTGSNFGTAPTIVTPIASSPSSTNPLIPTSPLDTGVPEVTPKTITNVLGADMRSKSLTDQRIAFQSKYPEGNELLPPEADALRSYLFPELTIENRFSAAGSNLKTLGYGIGKGTVDGVNFVKGIGLGAYDMVNDTSVTDIRKPDYLDNLSTYLGDKQKASITASIENNPYQLPGASVKDQVAVHEGVATASEFIGIGGAGAKVLKNAPYLKNIPGISTYIKEGIPGMRDILKAPLKVKQALSKAKVEKADKLFKGKWGIRQKIQNSKMNTKTKTDFVNTLNNIGIKKAADNESAFFELFNGTARLSKNKINNMDEALSYIDKLNSRLSKGIDKSAASRKKLDDMLDLIDLLD